MAAAIDAPFIPNGRFADLFETAMHSGGHPDFSVLRYEGAGHLMEVPYGACNSLTVHGSEVFDYGGEPILHSEAAADLWERQLEFFRQRLRHPTAPPTSAQLPLQRL